MTSKPQPRLIPLAIVALGALAALKMTGVYFGLSESAAQENQPAILFKQEQAPAAAEEETVAASPSSAEPHPQAPVGEVERRILEKLAARREALDERERKIALREDVAQAAEAKLARELAALQAERDAIEALREQREAEKAEDIETLVSTYEKMKARDAAEIFDALDSDVLLSVAANMRTQALAGVMANMKPERARALTVMLAQKNETGVEAEGAHKPADIQ